MTRTIVCKLNDNEHFHIEGAQEVNLNDSRDYRYTLWKRAKKHLYQIPQFFSDEALDLFYIALMVFCADKTVRRGETVDAWTRDIEIYMPVLKPEKWEELKDTLKKALDFLTGDRWYLHFRERAYTQHETYYQKRKFHYRKSIPTIDTETICMLSGGLDSFIGAIDMLAKGERPVFVGNYNGGKGVSVYQNCVINKLIDYFGIGKERFYQFYAAPIRGKEDTTRSRSMMFFAHAILLASGFAHPVSICIPENGVISLNIPLTTHRVGSLSTRTTHPYYIGLLQLLIDGLGIPVKLINPYQFCTKGEMMKQCKDQLFLKENFKFTMSCSHPDLSRWRHESGSKHCGVCLPCTIRRAAIAASGYEDDSIYGDPQYANNEAQANLLSYRLGIRKKKVSILAIQLNGTILEKHEEYSRVYEQGIKELKNFIDTL